MVHRAITTMGLDRNATGHWISFQLRQDMLPIYDGERVCSCCGSATYEYAELKRIYHTTKSFREMIMQSHAASPLGVAIILGSPGPEADGSVDTVYKKLLIDSVKTTEGWTTFVYQMEKGD